MNEQKDGGPAFPGRNDDRFGMPGMSLRDWFAGQALVGIFASLAHPDISPLGPVDYSLTATEAYKTSDAMLVERRR